ncbi:D-tyrosyl-tRNA(Tyr) deacylase [Candidatus Peregrinibacteria bacterium]|nr:D-tyrosyl-tRNA(Tyr) deacylase [Candidatus Peregrinibacteria bacterium]
MRALIQRVNKVKVEIKGQTLSQINKGFLVLLGVKQEDTEADGDFLVEKIANLRVFGDEKDKMNLSLLDIKGEVLVVSQFTLYADCRRGRRPDFIDAAKPELAQELYKKFIQRFKATGLHVCEGEFGAMMDVELVNSGPVTIMLDTAEIQISKLK